MSHKLLRKAMQLLTPAGAALDRKAELRKLISRARRANKRWLLDPNVIGYGVGYRTTAGRRTDDLALRIHVREKLPGSRLGRNRIPPILKLPGMDQPVSIDVVHGKVGRAQLALVGDGVCLSGSTEFGTLGCVMARRGSNDLFAVTCRHVLQGEPQHNVEWAEFPPAPAPPNPTIGTLTSFRSEYQPGGGFPNVTDIALVRLTPGSVSPVVRWLGPISGVRTTPLVAGEKVHLTGYGTSRMRAGSQGRCSGEVIEPHSNQTIEIRGHGELGFRDLVLCTRFTHPMDSGAGVLDSDNRLVGIHMAASDDEASVQWSAFQPIGAVIGSFGLALPKSASVAAPLTAPEAHAAGASHGRSPPLVGDRARAIDILARTLWGEGRGEPIEGRVGIANVVLNRVAKNKPARFGATLEAVCQKKYQFSCWNADDPNLPKLQAVTDANEKFRECLEIARQGVNGELADNTLGSDHYHTRKVRPAWSEGRVPAVTIGSHHFFNNIP